jgi:hypothetical protein
MRATPIFICMLAMSLIIGCQNEKEKKYEATKYLVTRDQVQNLGFYHFKNII